MAASDAIVLQYYEEDDPVKAAFGRELTMEEWTHLADITTTYQTMRFNVATVLGALGVTDYELPETIERRTPFGVKPCSSPSNFRTSR